MARQLLQPIPQAQIARGFIILNTRQLFIRATGRDQDHARLAHHHHRTAQTD